MKFYLWLLVFLVCTIHIQAQTLYSIENNMLYSAQILLNEDGIFLEANTSCETEYINKGTYKIANDTLYLNSYSTHDSIFPKVLVEYVSDTLKRVAMKVVDNNKVPWYGFSILTGRSSPDLKHYYTDDDGFLIFNDSTDVYFIIPSFLYASLKFSDTLNHQYFLSSNNYGTYIITIYEEQFFVLDRNTITMPAKTTKYKIEEECLVSPNGELYHRKNE